MTESEVVYVLESEGHVMTSHGRLIRIGDLRSWELGTRVAWAGDTRDDIDARLAEARYVRLSFVDYLVALTDSNA